MAALASASSRFVPEALNRREHAALAAGGTPMARARSLALKDRRPPGRLILRQAVLRDQHHIMVRFCPAITAPRLSAGPRSIAMCLEDAKACLPGLQRFPGPQRVLASLLSLLDDPALALDACFAFGYVPISLDQVLAFVHRWTRHRAAV